MVSTLLTVAELASDMGVGPSTVYKWIHEYNLPYYHIPSSGFRINPDEFQGWYGQFRQVKNQRVRRLV